MVKTGRPALELGAGVVENWKISREIGRFQGTARWEGSLLPKHNDFN